MHLDGKPAVIGTGAIRLAAVTALAITLLAPAAAATADVVVLPVPLPLPLVTSMPLPQGTAVPVNATVEVLFNVEGRVTFSAKVAEGDDRDFQYEWDFDGDGVYDETTGFEFADHEYRDAEAHDVVVRVSDRYGTSGLARVNVPARTPEAPAASESEGTGFFGSMLVAPALIALAIVAILIGFGIRQLRRPARDDKPSESAAGTSDSPYGPKREAAPAHPPGAPWTFRFPVATTLAAAAVYPAFITASTLVGNDGWNYEDGFWSTTALSETGFGAGIAAAATVTALTFTLAITADVRSRGYRARSDGSKTGRIAMWCGVSIASLAAALFIAFIAGLIFSAIATGASR